VIKLLWVRAFSELGGDCVSAVQLEFGFGWISAALTAVFGGFVDLGAGSNKQPDNNSGRLENRSF